MILKNNFNTIINTRENKTEKVNTICSLRNNQKNTSFTAKIKLIKTYSKFKVILKRIETSQL